jgi:hypothetical protein
VTTEEQRQIVTFDNQRTKAKHLFLFREHLQLVSQQGWQGQWRAISISISETRMTTMKMPKVSVLFLPWSQSAVISYSDGQ